jgi:2-oxoglutarate ferredoxin oxidoreductase subunit alpha
MMLRAKFLVDVVGYNQVRGLPFKAAELEAVFVGAIDAANDAANDAATDAATDGADGVAGSVEATSQEGDR